MNPHILSNNRSFEEMRRLVADQVFGNVVLLAFQSEGLVCDEGLRFACAAKAP